MRAATRPPGALAVVLLLAASTTACSQTGEDRPTVVVSTNILGDVVEEVVGPEAEVVTLMPADADPHSFEVSAREAARMRAADLVVSNGLGLEEGLQRQLDAAELDGAPGFVAGEAVDVLDYADGDAAGTPDPHFWTDPGRMVDVVEALAPVLAGIEGVDAAVVEDRAERYVEALDDVASEMAASFASIPDERRALVTNHHVFGYLAERYDFEVVGAVIPGGTTLASPSVSDLAGLVSAIEDTGVRAVFAESSSPDRLVQALADEADVEVDVVPLFSESLSGPGGGAEDYLTMLRANTARITGGLT